MSCFYNFDVFLSCAHDDRESARLLAKKLRELKFHVWLDFEHSPNESSSSAKALEDSAVCLVLVGVAGNLSWMRDSYRLLIQKRLASTDRGIRIITVFLPTPHSHARLILPHPFFISGDHRQGLSNFIRFRKTLDENDRLHELVLRIRGIDPEQSFDRSFRNAVQLRAQNTLDVDWYTLARDVYFSRLSNPDALHVTLPRRVLERKPANPSSCEVRILGPDDLSDKRRPLERLRLVQPSESKQIYWSKARFRSIGSIAAIAAMLLVFIGVLKNLDRRYFGAGPKANVVVEQPAPESTKPSDKVGAESEKKKRSVETTNIVAATKPSSNSNEWRNRPKSFVESSDHASYSLTLQADRNPEPESSPDSSVIRSARFGFTVLHRRKVTQREQERFSAVIDPKGNQKPQAFIVSADIGDESSKAGSERTNDPSRDVLLSSNEVSREAKDPELWKTFDRSKLAAIKEIYVEFSNDADVDAELRSRVITEFIKPLQENGVEVVSKREERGETLGTAKLRFGEREMKSGVVSVDIEDSKGQVIKRFFAPATCTPLNQNALVKILCDASQILGDKLSDALQNAEQQ